MTQIFVASTFYGAMSLAAAIDAGLFGTNDQRRILLMSNNTAVPEIAASLDESPGFAALRDRFGEILSWNELLWPAHPSTWSPRNQDRTLLYRLLRHYWSLGDEPLHLVVESIQVPPARALAEIFEDATITVYSDGLMSYGPSRESPPREMATRIDQVLYLDLVPGVRPLLLSEYPEVELATVPADAFRGVVKEVATQVDAESVLADRDLSGVPMVIGQYMAALEIITAEEEDELHARMLRGIAAQGHRKVIFKPHPSSTTRMFRALRASAEQAGVELAVLDAPFPVEVWYEKLRPSLVVGCFSTGLSTAASFYDLPTATVGAELPLQRITPYQNSNRIPITLADAAMPRMADNGDIQPPRIPAERFAEQLTPLLSAISYCMQSSTYPHLRDAAVTYLSQHSEAEVSRYFKRRRLTALRLPGASQRRYPSWLVAGARRIRPGKSSKDDKDSKENKDN
ncbi:alpha-2,8-polysialyltransferase family protein [Salinactinospora qingdaonensis]|uniref:Alpha-2,8-polysialyltransferase family protein n=1 Tax=Salinactinospora qingdaonensis TaxID=702744 RepID=A0ABP7FX63_9ACTN